MWLLLCLLQGSAPVASLEPQAVGELVQEVWAGGALLSPGGIASLPAGGRACGGGQCLLPFARGILCLSDDLCWAGWRAGGGRAPGGKGVCIQPPRIGMVNLRSEGSLGSLVHPLIFTEPLPGAGDSEEMEEISS